MIICGYLGIVWFYYGGFGVVLGRLTCVLGCCVIRWYDCDSVLRLILVSLVCLCTLFEFDI